MKVYSSPCIEKLFTIIYMLSQCFQCFKSKSHFNPFFASSFLIYHSGYRKAQTQANDSFYVRAQFDRFPHGKGELSFRKGDILHVTETFYKGQLGVWRASIVNDSETIKPSSGKLTKGKIPSKRK